MYRKKVKGFSEYFAPYLRRIKQTYTCPLSSCTQNLKTLALIEGKKFVTETLLGEKAKWTNKGNDKQQHADSLLHNTKSHTQHLYQISKSWA